MLIPLICKQCGGKLEVEDTKISLVGDSFIVLPNQNFECPHCGTKYISDDTNKHMYVSNGGIAIGSLSFGGDVTGNIVIASGVSPDSSSVKTGESTSSGHSVLGKELKDITPSSTKKQTKKWWEFWK